MQLLRKLFGRSTPKHRPTVKPRLEALEDRMVPSTVAAAPDGTTYAIAGSNRALYHYDTSGNRTEVLDWTTGQYVTNVSMVAAGADGSIDYVTTDGTLRQANPNWANNWGWLPVQIPYAAAPISALAAGQNGQVYISWASYKGLWEHDGSGWHFLNDTNVADLSVGGYGQLYVVNTNGSLYSADAANDSWSRSTLLSSGVTHVAGGANWDFFITFGSNHQLWEMHNGLWYNQFITDYGYGGFYRSYYPYQISADTSGGLEVVGGFDGNGTLFHTGNYYQAQQELPPFDIVQS
jgi:hypothetical protein